VEKISQRVRAGARNVAIGGVAGWGLVVVAGAVLMTNATQDKTFVASAPSAAATDMETKPIEPPAPKAEAAPAIVAASAPAPVAAKSTQRIDMTPTAAIPADPIPKPKHKAHKKKPKDLDNHN
jgi:hypothetical protein